MKRLERGSWVGLLVGAICGLSATEAHACRVPTRFIPANSPLHQAVVVVKAVSTYDAAAPTNAGAHSGLMWVANLRTERVLRGSGAPKQLRAVMYERTPGACHRIVEKPKPGERYVAYIADLNGAPYVRQLLSLEWARANDPFFDETTHAPQIVNR